MFMHKETLHCGAHGLCCRTTVSGLAPIPIQTTIYYYYCRYYLSIAVLSSTHLELRCISRLRVRPVQFQRQENGQGDQLLMRKLKVA